MTARPDIVVIMTDEERATPPYESDEVLSWNSPTVLLARFSKYTWWTDETFTADIEVAHFGPQDLTAGGAWRLERSDGSLLASGR